MLLLVFQSAISWQVRMAVAGLYMACQRECHHKLIEVGGGTNVECPPVCCNLEVFGSRVFCSINHH